MTPAAARIPAVAILLATAAPGVAAAACWSEAGRAAVAVRVLQSELTLGALVCGHRGAYARFVERQEAELRRHGEALAAHFHGAYGPAEGERRLDAFATRLANEASGRKTAWTSDYCAYLKALTDRAAALPPDRLAAFAAAQPNARRTAAEGACAAEK